MIRDKKKEKEEKYTQYIEKIKRHKSRLSFIDRIIYPYYNTYWEVILYNIISPKYLTNVLFFTTLFAYATRLDRLFLLLLPINIANTIIITIIEVMEWTEVLYSIIGNNKFKELSLDLRKKIIDNDPELNIASHIFSIGYHGFILGILLYLYNVEEYNQINYIENIQIGIFGLLVFWLISKNPYGNINEPLYVISYIIVLILINYLLFYCELLI